MDEEKARSEVSLTASELTGWARLPAVAPTDTARVAAARRLGVDRRGRTSILSAVCGEGCRRTGRARWSWTPAAFRRTEGARAHRLPNADIDTGPYSSGIAHTDMSVLLETSLGDLVIDLEVDACPELSENFLKVRPPPWLLPPSHHGNHPRSQPTAS